MAVPATAYADTPFGTVKAWGRNATGQLGDGTTADSSTPVTVSDLTDVQAISGGTYSAYALLTDSSTVKAWGSNRFGQLGDGTTDNSLTPVTVQVLTDEDEDEGVTVEAIAAGNGSAYALLSNGTVKAWGDNSSGQLGNGTTDNSLTPVTVSGLNDGGVTVEAIAVSGNGSAYALLSDHTVKAWGLNDYGQLGDGTTDNRSTPVYVVDDANVNLSGVQKIAAGYASAYALINDGTVKAVKAWGRNNNGQLGDGSTRNSSTPVTVSGLADDVEDIAAGWASGYALLANGTVQAWGDNASGQLGNGTGGNGTHDYDSLTPVTVSGLTDGNVVVSAIAVDDVSGYALLSDSTVKAWGSNNNGQLGDGTTNNNRTTPVPVSGLTTAVQAIDAGYGSAYAMVAPTDTNITALSAPQTPVTEGDEVTFTATVEPDADDKMEYFAGTVEFFNGTTSLGTAEVDSGTGVATLTTTVTPTELPVGDVLVTAKFTPTKLSAFNQSPLSSVSATLTVAARTTTTLTANQTSVAEGDEVTLTATVTPTAAGSVEFFNGTTSLGTADTYDAATGVATLTTTALPVGTNSVTAKFTSDDEAAFTSSTSTEVTVTVDEATTDTDTDENTEDTEGASEGDEESSDADSDEESSDADSDEESSETEELPQTGDSSAPVAALTIVAATTLTAGVSYALVGRTKTHRKF